MSRQSSSTFRILIISYIALAVAFYAAGLNEDPFTASVYEYMSSIHPGLKMSFDVWTVLTVLHMGGLVAGLVGLWIFWGPSRWLLIASLLLGYATSYIMGVGPVVMSRITNDIGAATNLCLGAILGLSFFGSIANDFKTRRKRDNVS